MQQIKRGGQMQRRIPVAQDALDDLFIESLFAPDKDAQDVVPINSRADRIPYAETDLLKKLLSEREPTSFDMPDLIALMEAEDMDILLQERKWEQQSAEWIYEKEAAKEAVAFYKNPENADKKFEVTFMHDGSMKHGKFEDGTFLSMTFEEARDTWTDSQKFSYEKNSLKNMVRILREMQQGHPIDGQFERPALVDYLNEKINYWQMEATSQLATKEQKEAYEKYIQVYEELHKKALTLKTREDHN